MFELLFQTFWAKNPSKKSADLHPRQGKLHAMYIGTFLQGSTKPLFTSQNRVETS
jgi:hypothetical protein